MAMYSFTLLSTLTLDSACKDHTGYRASKGDSQSALRRLKPC